MAFIEGMPAVGYSPPCGAYPWQDAVRLTLESALAGADIHNARIGAELKASPHDDFRLEQSTKDAVAGLRWSQLLRQIKGARMIEADSKVRDHAGCGKKRVIDDAAKGGQSALSSDANKLVLCSPLTMSYFDDAHVTDWASSKGSAQATFASLNELLGIPFFKEKRQPMNPRGTNLGLDFDLSPVPFSGGVRFSVRERLQTKVKGILESTETSGVLTSGVACKLYGVLNFPEQGVYGRIGAGGLAALKDRLQERDTTMTAAALQQCFYTIWSLLTLKPQRVVEVVPAPCAQFMAASDAAEDTPGPGTGGFLLVWKDVVEVREAFKAEVTPALYRLFTPGMRKIAQLELGMVLFALVNRPDRFRGRRRVFYIDSLAALMALSRGRSDAPDLEHLSRLIHGAMFALQTWVYSGPDHSLPAPCSVWV